VRLRARARVCACVCVCVCGFVLSWSFSTDVCVCVCVCVCVYARVCMHMYVFIGDVVCMGGGGSHLDSSTSRSLFPASTVFCRLATCRCSCARSSVHRARSRSAAAVFCAAPLSPSVALRQPVTSNSPTPHTKTAPPSLTSSSRL
jgi:hypothetical protein